MADEITGNESVEELRAILAAKNQELVDTRQARLEAEQEKADEVQAAQLREEIRRVQGNINLEVQQLEISANQDPERIGAGTLSLDAQPVAQTPAENTPPLEPTVPKVVTPALEPNVPEVPSVPVADPVASAGAPSNEGGKK